MLIYLTCLKLDPQHGPVLRAMAAQSLILEALLGFWRWNWFDPVKKRGSEMQERQKMGNTILL